MSGTEFLYPFLDAASVDETERSSRRTALRADLCRSAGEKWQLSLLASDTAVAANAEPLAQAAALLRAARRILVAGNGGSACDADRFVRLGGGRRPLLSLVADQAVLTALANDIGVERMFARQVDAIGRPGDVLVVWSTSGQSANLVAALAQARRQGLGTIAFAGYGGGRFVDNADVDVAIVVHDTSVHRIQETQAALVDALWALVAAP